MDDESLLRAWERGCGGYSLTHQMARHPLFARIVERGEQLGLTDAEIAFYDALETSDSAVAVMGDDVLKEIARELAETVRRNTTIDWTLKESARAGLRVAVRRLLRRYRYPPEKTEEATQTVLRQAELFAGEHLLAS